MAGRGGVWGITIKPGRYKSACLQMDTKLPEYAL